VLGELGAAALYLSALARMDIANATAIIQTVPLAATAAAALILGEKVGVRRWSAVAIGFLAVCRRQRIRSPCRWCRLSP
jgi:S-adenosylmethionine uptake transporter